MLGHPPFIELFGGLVLGAVAAGGVDGVVDDELDAASATVMPRPKLRPSVPATTPAASSGRVSVKLSSLPVLAGSKRSRGEPLVRHFTLEHSKLQILSIQAKNSRSFSSERMS